MVHKENTDRRRNLSGLSFLLELSSLTELFLPHRLHKIQSRAKIPFFLTWSKFTHLQEVVCRTSTQFVTSYKSTNKVVHIKPIHMQQQPMAIKPKHAFKVFLQYS